MATEQEKQDGIWQAIVSALAAEAIKEIPHLASLGIKGVAKLFHPHKKAILDTLKAADVKPGDPLPPDPTHPHP